MTWSNWGAYEACSVTCGDGMKTRTRTCSDPSITRDVCPGSSSDTTNCNVATCGMYIYVTQLLLITSMWLLNCIGMMINFHFFLATWSKRGSYRTCSVTCGDGMKMRTRTCLNPPSTADVCPGSSSETNSCNDVPCSMCVYITQMLSIISIYVSTEMYRSDDIFDFLKVTWGNWALMQPVL